MLTPILATSDPYATAELFVAAGWSLVFQTPPDSGDPLTCVELAGARVMLGTSEPAFLAPAAVPYKGAGVEFHVTMPEPRIRAVYEAHREHGTDATELAEQPWGELAFHAVLAGYRFLIAAER